MPDQSKINIADWVEEVSNDPVAYEQRKATEILLTAIGISSPLSGNLYLKGGVLLGLVYNSPRQTTDVDFTTSLMADEKSVALLGDELTKALPKAAAELGYVDFLVVVNSIKLRPKPEKFTSSRTPAILLKVGYFKAGSKQQKTFEKVGNVSDTIEADISFNEETQSTQVLSITEQRSIMAYGLSDIIAEKYRAMIQQVNRNRYRRQDVYDLNYLITLCNNEVNLLRQEILQSFRLKCESRLISPTITSLDNPEIKERSAKEWGTLRDELGEIPEFEESFSTILTFFKSLPW